MHWMSINYINRSRQLNPNSKYIICVCVPVIQSIIGLTIDKDNNVGVVNSLLVLNVI